MTFLIVTHVLHKESGGKYFAYGPYIREMNLWLKYSDKVIIVAPVVNGISPKEIDLEYSCPDINFIMIPEFDLIGFGSFIRSLFLLPLIIIRVVSGIGKADHVHLRCPGNVGLLACFVQIFFPKKKKTAKYAGNWDWKSKQPWSYRLQQRILRSTFLTRNMTVLVYGEWPDKTKNIMPFFTASYSEADRLPVRKNTFDKGVKLAFVGGLADYKSPLTSLEVLKELTDNGINASLTYCGDGPERQNIEQKVVEWHLDDRVILSGNVDAKTVKTVLQESHFLVFISKSEGWPKAVAEAMWWGCMPITTAVSCVPQMLGDGERGELVNDNPKEIAEIIEYYTQNEIQYSIKTEKAMTWSREFTLEKFESEIKQIISR